MISYDDALRIIRAAARPLPPRPASPQTAAGMASAVEIRSRVSVPSFANAAMDGFALRSTETLTASGSTPRRFIIAGSIAAGARPPPATPTGSAWEITTGAPMPADCDAVVPIEGVEQVPATSGGAAAILVRDIVTAGQNRRSPGEDFRAGDVLLRPGDPLTPQAVMGLAATGSDSLEVRLPPRIAVITTGSELSSGGARSDAGRIRDANGPYLAAALGLLQIPVTGQVSLPDEPDQLARAIEANARAADLIITTGGVSAGRLDFVPATLANLGGEILFHRVAIRPGKPLLCARLPGGTLVVGLPGNPVAVAVGFRFFVLPALRAMQGMAAERFVLARCAEPVRKRPSLTFFAKAIATITTDATLEVRLLPGQESFKISPLLQANCWAIVPEGRENVSAGEILPVAPLMPSDFPRPAQ